MSTKAIPATMRAVEISAPGAPAVLSLVERETPRPARGEVLIRVTAAGVNRPDVLQRQGRYPPPPGASDLPGLEVAGEIVAVAADAERWRVGDRVCALLAGGGYAEYALAPALQCLPIPRGLTEIEAACLPETCFTVWHNVFERGALAETESLLVHGGASGIGTIAIQIARARGATVYATAGTAEKCRCCERLGARRAIDYRNEDFVAVIGEQTDGRGVDVILDMVAGPYLGRDIECAAEDGRIVIIAFIGGSRAEIDFRPVMMRRLTLTGSTLRARPAAFKGRLARAVLENVWPLLEAGEVRPLIDRRYPLGRAAEAHARMESGRHTGKLVLEVAANG